MGYYNKKDPFRRIWLALVYEVHLILGVVLQLGGPIGIFIIGTIEEAKV